MTVEPEEPEVVVEATPDDVAALLTARTKDANGRELGEWTDETRPTRAEVQTRIEIARTLVRTGAGFIPDKCVEGVEAAVALLASMLTEAAFWPEQTQSNQSTYERLRELYLQAREAVVLCVAGGPEGAGGGAYELDVSGFGACALPLDWWQRNLDNALARVDAIREGALV
jgi:hypothetical protein